MFNMIVAFLSVGLTLQGCAAAPWLAVLSNDNSSGLVTPCQRDDDCVMAGWEAPYPQCILGGCRCGSPNPCRQRTYTVSWESYAYFCGQCGVMGSSCTFDQDCPQPFDNCYDGYCKCYKGYIFRGICRVDHIMSSASVSNIMLCVLLLLVLVLNKVVASRRFRNLIRRGALCCTNRGEAGSDSPHVGADGVFHNPRSGEKTASYTISNSDFITSTDDPDLEWAIELSRQLQEDSSRQPGGNSRASSIRASIRSRTSNMTRSSSRSRASNTSRRSVVGTERARTGGRNVPRTATSTDNRETIDDVNHTIRETALDATLGENASSSPALTTSNNSTKIDNGKEGSHVIQEDKSISTVRNVHETNQTSSLEDEKFPLNTIMNSTHKTSPNAAIAATSCDELKDQPKPSSVPLRKTASTSSGSYAISDSDELSRSTEDSVSNKSCSGDAQEQSTSRGNKVAGKGKMIILVPRKTY